MEVVIKIYLGFFMLIFFLFTAGGMLGAQIEVSNAQDFKNDVISVLENSDFDSNVMSNCIQEAENRNYLLNVQGYDEKGQAIIADNSGGSMPAKIKMAEVQLTFLYRPNPFSDEINCTFRGYTR
ncbi:MAG: hypothetical protein ACK5ML_10800 [Lachnospiraceae bacterium]